MKFLVDAQLPVRLAQLLERTGHDATHTVDLPRGNRSSDREVIHVADAQGRVVVTKDRDFRDVHLLHGAPQKLLVIATGNITNDALLSLFEAHLDAIESAFAETDFVELSRNALTLGGRSHGRRGQT